MNTIVDRIEKFNAALIPDMVQLKYKAMAESPFRFFRGTCHLFYEDLVRAKGFPASPLAWICGDLHLENFGSFKGNNRQVYFDLNDFDESMLSPLNWELARVLTSIYVAFDTLKLKKALADEMVSAFLTKYTETLKTGKAHYIDPRTADGTVKSFLNGIELRKEKELINKITGTGAKKLDIKIDNLTHFKIDKKLKGELIAHITDWLDKTPVWPNNYKVKDAAFRVAGTGSIGLKRYMFLLQGTKKKDKFLLVELKQGTSSSLAPYNKVPQPEWTSDAEIMYVVWFDDDDGSLYSNKHETYFKFINLHFSCSCLVCRIGELPIGLLVPTCTTCICFLLPKILISPVSLLVLLLVAANIVRLPRHSEEACNAREKKHASGLYRCTLYTKHSFYEKNQFTISIGGIHKAKSTICAILQKGQPAVQKVVKNVAARRGV